MKNVHDLLDELVAENFALRDALSRLQDKFGLLAQGRNALHRRVGVLADEVRDLIAERDLTILERGLAVAERDEARRALQAAGIHFEVSP